MDAASYPIICVDCSEPFHEAQMRLVEVSTNDDGTQSETWECPGCQIIALYDEPIDESENGCV